MSEIHEKFAADLHALRAEREAAFIDELNDSEVSFVAASHQILRRHEVVAERDGGLAYLGTSHDTPLHQLSALAHSLDTFIKPSEEGREYFDFTDASKTVEALRAGYYATTDPGEKIGFVSSIACIAAVLQPEEVRNITRKRTKETPEQKGYRTAVNTLRTIAISDQRFEAMYGEVARAIIGTYYMGQIDRFVRGNSDYPEDIERYNQYMIQGRVTNELLGLVQRPPFTGKQLQRQILFYRHREQQLKETEEWVEALQTPIKPNVETGWTILPGVPKTVGQIALAEVGLYELDHESSLPTEEGLSEKDRRILHLSRFALMWYSNDIEKVKIAERKLGHTKRDEFLVALLHHRLADGTVITHALAEANGDRNALFAFRAETGMNPDGSVWLTWEDVFKDDRDSARLLGARKIVHRKEFFDENLLEYMTREVKDLDKPGYGRKGKKRSSNPELVRV